MGTWLYSTRLELMPCYSTTWRSMFESFNPWPQARFIVMAARQPGLRPRVKRRNPSTHTTRRINKLYAKTCAWVLSAQVLQQDLPEWVAVSSSVTIPYAVGTGSFHRVPGGPREQRPARRIPFNAPILTILTNVLIPRGPARRFKSQSVTSLKSSDESRHCGHVSVSGGDLRQFRLSN